MSAPDKIRVAVRVRPRDRADSPSMWNYDQQHVSLSRASATGGPAFTFDAVFGESASNNDIYNSFAKPISLSVLSGLNATIFAYGQTATGKTHTMTGTPASPGLIPLIITDIFNEIQRPDHVQHFFPGCPSTAGAEFCLRVSYVEIYNESVNDLLTPGAVNLDIHDTGDGRVELNCQELIVKTPAQVLDIIRRGAASRHVGATNVNEYSSRSHTIFRLTLESTLTGDFDDYGDGGAGTAHVAVLTLVDLAGSERIAHTRAEGARRVEAGQINKSLLTLGTVIFKLSEGKPQHIPYRDSKLTRILQPSLGGNARTGVICTISLAPSYYEETLSTLKFASRAKRVENTPIVNEVQDTTTVLNDLKRQIRLLKQQLAQERSEKSEKELATLSQSIIATPGRPRPRPLFSQQQQSVPQPQFMQPLMVHEQQQQIYQQQMDKRLAEQQKEYEIKLKKTQQLLEYAKTRADDAEKLVKEKDSVISVMQNEMTEAVMQYEEQITKLNAKLSAQADVDSQAMSVVELQNQISDLSDQLEESSRTAETLQAELNAANAARQQQTRRCAELEQTIRELSEALTQEPPAKRVSITPEAVSELRERAEVSQTRVTQLEAQLEAFSGELRARDLRVAELVGKQAQLEAACMSAEAARQDVSEECARMRQFMEQREAQFREATAAMEAHHRELSSKLDDAVEAQTRAEQDASEARDTLAQREAQCAALEGSLAVLRAIPRDSSSASAGVSRSDEDIARLENRVKELEKEAEEIAADYEERVRDLEAQRDELMEENISVRQARAQDAARAKDEIERLGRQRDAQHRRWRAEREQDAGEVRNAKAYVRSLEERVAELERAAGRVGAGDSTDGTHSHTHTAIDCL